MSGLFFGPPSNGWPDFERAAPPRLLRCYLAGPVRGAMDSFRTDFAEGERQLKKLGWVVISPVTLMDENHQVPGIDADDRAGLALDIENLVKCDAVMLLPGWEQSRGAKAEVAVAVALDIPYFLPGFWPSVASYTYFHTPGQAGE